MRILVFWVLILAGFANSASGQMVGITTPPEIDTNYVRNTWDTWSIRLFTSRKTNKFSINALSTNTSMRYIPDKIWVAGIGIAYKFVLLDFGIAIPRKGESTKRFDANLSFRMLDGIIDIGYRRYTGFNPQDNDGGEYGFRSDIRSQVLSIDYFHSFSSGKLPYRDLSTGRQVQKKSVGSFGIGVYGAWDELKADSSLIPTSLFEFFNEDARVDFTSQVTIGFLAGYSYSLVLPKSMFFFASVLPGVGLNTGKIDAVTSYNPLIFPTVRLNVRAALGYIGTKKIYVILSGTTDTTFAMWKSKNLYAYSIFQLKLAVGYRFNSEIGFLENAAKRLEQFEFK